MTCYFSLHIPYRFTSGFFKLNVKKYSDQDMGIKKRVLYLTQFKKALTDEGLIKRKNFRVFYENT